MFLENVTKQKVLCDAWTCVRG